MPELALRPDVLGELRTNLRASNKPTAQTLLGQTVEPCSISATELAELLETNAHERFVVFACPRSPG